MITTASSKKRQISWKNLAIGGVIQVFEVSTLGQPFEVVKTQMAANSNQGLLKAIDTVWKQSGIRGFWRGLIPVRNKTMCTQHFKDTESADWAWIEASTKGAVLLFTASEIEWAAQNYTGLSKSASGVLGGMGGGIAQAYSTMGFCTFMKTVEVTRHRTAGVQQSSLQIAAEILKKEGIVGINKGVNAVALRQMTNWGSRLGISRIVESIFMNMRDATDRGGSLSVKERLGASIIGGGLACWNQPIEVIRVKMQSQIKDPTRPAKMTIVSCAKWIYQQNGFLGFYRGVTPRIGLSVYLTVCMVFGGDEVKKYFAS